MNCEANLLIYEKRPVPIYSDKTAKPGGATGGLPGPGGHGTLLPEVRPGSAGEEIPAPGIT